MKNLKRRKKFRDFRRDKNVLMLSRDLAQVDKLQIKMMETMQMMEQVKSSME